MRIVMKVVTFHYLQSPSTLKLWSSR